MASDNRAERILVVDDDETARMLFRRGLQHYGFGDVHAVASARLAFLALELDASGRMVPGAVPPVSLVLLDVGLPDINGFEVCYRIKQAYGERLPVILVTGFRLDTVQDQFLRCGGDDFLRKPVNPEELAARVRIVLDRHRQDAQEAMSKTHVLDQEPKHAIPYHGDRVDRYEIVDLLDRTGSMLVYKVTDAESGAACVMKMVPVYAKRDEERVRRFRREVGVMREVDHPSLVQVIDEGVYNKCPFMVREYIPGETLATLLQREGRVAHEQAASIGADIADALRHLHACGIIHRDITVRNVIVRGSDGRAFLDDSSAAFRIDDLTDTTHRLLVGLPAHMPPELFEGRALTPASDVYSFGCLMYHILAGEPPFAGATVREFLDRQLTLAPRQLSEVRDDLPAGWDELIVRRCLAREMAQRPQAMDEVAAGLEALAAASR